MIALPFPVHFNKVRYRYRPVVPGACAQHHFSMIISSMEQRTATIPDAERR